MESSTISSNNRASNFLSHVILPGTKKRQTDHARLYPSAARDLFHAHVSILSFYIIILSPMRTTHSSIISKDKNKDDQKKNPQEKKKPGEGGDDDM